LRWRIRWRWRRWTRLQAQRRYGSRRGRRARRYVLFFYRFGLVCVRLLLHDCCLVCLAWGCFTGVMSCHVIWHHVTKSSRVPSPFAGLYPSLPLAPAAWTYHASYGISIPLPISPSSFLSLFLPTNTLAHARKSDAKQPEKSLCNLHVNLNPNLNLTYPSQIPGSGLDFSMDPIRHPVSQLKVRAVEEMEREEE
jgi:hypothetical protein